MYTISFETYINSHNDREYILYLHAFVNRKWIKVITFLFPFVTIKIENKNNDYKYRTIYCGITKRFLTKI